MKNFLLSIPMFISAYFLLSAIGHIESTFNVGTAIIYMILAVISFEVGIFLSKLDDRKDNKK